MSAGRSDPQAIDPEAVLDAMAPMLGLSITEEDRAGVALHLATAARLYALVDAVAIDDHAEPAPVFAPVTGDAP